MTETLANTQQRRHMAEHSWSGSGANCSIDPGDEYAFYRSFAAAEAANDPELAALLAHNAALMQKTEQQQQQQKPQSAATGAESAVCCSKAGPHDLVMHIEAAGSGSAGAAAGAAAAGAAAAGAPPQDATHKQLQGLQAAAAAEVPAAGAVAVHRQVKPDFSRKQLKSLRRLFPMQPPAVKSAVTLQGDYQVLEELGRGAFGCVHKACHLPTGQLVCIKAVEAAAGQAEASLEQQKREVAVLACLQHPNIIKYLDCFADGPTLNILMEYADSGDLHRLLQQHAKAGSHLQEDQLLRYFVQLVAALAHIHSRGLMHRDVKANNVFLTRQGLLKLGDFGLVKVLDAGQSMNGGATLLSNNGGSIGSFIASENRGAVAQSFVGTPNILAPEQLGGPYNQKADIWALGCVLYQMAALRAAFSADRIAVIFRMIRRARVPQLPAMYSPALRALHQQLMQRDPCSRPSSIELMQDPLLRPHLEAYEQQLQQQGLELPPLPANIFSTSGSGATHSTAARASMHSSTAGVSTCAGRHSLEMTLQATAAVAAVHADAGDTVQGVTAETSTAGSAEEGDQASRDGSNSSVAGSSCLLEFSEAGGRASQCAGVIVQGLSVQAGSTEQWQQQQQRNEEGVEPAMQRLRNKKSLVRWLRKRFKIVLCGGDGRACEETTMYQPAQQPNAAAAGLWQGQIALAVIRDQAQQQQAEQQPCDPYAGQLPTLSELRLLPPLRHTLSTVLSSNLSTATSSSASNSAAMLAVFESGSGCGQRGSSSSSSSSGTAAGVVSPLALAAEVHSSTHAAEGAGTGPELHTSQQQQQQLAGEVAEHNLQQLPTMTSLPDHHHNHHHNHQQQQQQDDQCIVVHPDDLTVDMLSNCPGAAPSAAPRQQQCEARATATSNNSITCSACDACVEMCPTAAAAAAAALEGMSAEPAALAQTLPAAAVSPELQQTVLLAQCLASATAAQAVIPHAAEAPACLDEALVSTSSTDCTCSYEPTAAASDECSAAAAAEAVLVPHGLYQEQLAVQAAVRRLRTQLRSAADELRSAAVASPWGSCDSCLGDAGGDRA